MKKNGSMYFFYVVICIVIVALAVITLAMKSESTSFAGIADAKEIVINVQSAVEIKKIRVVPGQVVKEGDTLIEINNVSDNNRELDIKISSIGHEIEEINTRRNAHANLSRSEVRQLKSQQEERKNQITAEIQQLESQYDINRNLMSGLKSIRKEAVADKDLIDQSSPIALKISNLKKELLRIQDSSQITLDRLHNEQSVSGDPFNDQVRQLKDELKMLESQKLDMYILARISGMIGTVDFKEGEKIAPFTPILTLHTISPSFVRGYIHENSYSRVEIGKKLLISSMDVKKLKISGEVIGVGSRIVEYPIRLRKYPDLQMWGREVTIKIPEGNKLLLGEKVLVSVPTDNAGILSIIKH
jgi:multidrug resistance efflux pump